MQGIQKARDIGFLDWNSGNSTWSLEEYEHYEAVRVPHLVKLPLRALLVA